MMRFLRWFRRAPQQPSEVFVIVHKGEPVMVCESDAAVRREIVAIRPRTRTNTTVYQVRIVREAR